MIPKENWIAPSKIRGVAKQCGPALQNLSAPYIRDTATLIPLPHPSEKIAFLRTSPEVHHTRDIFSAGDFKLQEFQWPSTAGADIGKQALDAFDGIDPSVGLLAGYFSYEAGYLFEERWLQRLPLPVTGFAWRFLQLPCWYIADHSSATGAICWIDGCPAESIARLQDLIKQHQHREVPVPTECRPDETGSLAAISELGELQQPQYESRVSNILEDIVAGRYYELNFTQRFRTTSNIAPSNLFPTLFARLAPAHAFYCHIGNEVVCSFSPELYISKLNDAICTRPIKGSMMQGASKIDWDKLHAEHVMVVDLARNDLGRISDKAPVQVDEFMKTRRFGGLNHLESAISGTSSFHWREIIRQTFPAASITGAPKVEVVEAINSYEASPRHIYTGACGCIWPDGNMNLNVAIRTAWANRLEGKWHYKIGAGGAIVAESDPAAEYVEGLRKAAPILNGLCQ